MECGIIKAINYGFNRSNYCGIQMWTCFDCKDVIGGDEMRIPLVEFGR